VAIELYFSNQLEILLDKFATVVDRENEVKQNILEGPFTIVPNQNLMKWMQLTLARKRSVFMNVDFQYLEKGLWELLVRLDSTQDPPEMMDSAYLRMFLLHALKSLSGDETDLRPLRAYLLLSGGEKGPDYAVKLWQLTERMVRLFEEYQFHRSEMIQKWLDTGYRSSGMERCQQTLYLQMRRLRDRYVQSSQRRLLSLAEYADRVFAAGTGDLKAPQPKKWVHIFGLSQISAFHLGLIGRLQDHFDIFIYSLNPCREFWEDIKTPQEKKWIRKRAVRKLEITPEEYTQGELSKTEDNDLLAFWGRPGREHIRLLCQLTDYDFHACFAKEATEESVLHELQRRILTLSVEGEMEEKRPQDRSLQIMACPGIYREVETVYNNILYNLETDTRLQLTDIAIFVPDMSRYKPVIDSVFNHIPRRLRYNLVDSRPDIESIYGQAVLGILGLVEGRFSRKEVFDFMMNPCFMNRWQIGAEAVNIWAGWTEALNIYHSFDRDSKREQGYPANHYYTWKQGLQRLRLSRIMSAPDEGAGEGFGHFHELVPFFDVNTDDTDLVGKFSVIVEKLHGAVKALSGLRSSGAEWISRFLKVCDDLLVIPSALRGEAAVRQSLIEALGDFRIYDELLKDRSRKTGAEADIDMELIREFIRSNLRAISGGYGDYLTDGVTISALQPMRPIPFRIIYVLGMEEGAFPGKADRSSLDLRLLKRRIGDISLPERNQYLFLEMLLSVRKKLYLSYMSRDLQKDRAIQPCSVVNQLRRYVEQEILPEGIPFRITDIPLKGSNETYLAPDALNTTSDLLVNYSAADRIALYRESGLWEEVTAHALEEERSRLQVFFPDFSKAAHRPEKEKKIVEKITLKQLKKFMEDPVSHGMKRHLGIYDEEVSVEEITLKEDEPFYSEFPIDYNLKMEPLKRWLDLYFSPKNAMGDRETPEDIYDHVYESLRRNSSTPDGAFAELDKDELRDDVSMRAGTLFPVLAEMGSGKEIYGAFLVGEQTDEQLPSTNALPVDRFRPARLVVKTAGSLGEDMETTVELHGHRPYIWKDREGGWHSLVLAGSDKTPKKKDPPDKYILEPVLFWICCVMSEDGHDRIGEPEVTIHVVYKEGIRTWTYCIHRDAAKEYMERLVSDYLNHERMEWLPFDVVTSRSIKPHQRIDDDMDDEKKETYYAQLCEAYTDEISFLVRLARPHIPDDAFDKVRDRFRIFFAGEIRK